MLGILVSLFMQMSINKAVNKILIIIIMITLSIIVSLVCHIQSMTNQVRLCATHQIRIWTYKINLIIHPHLIRMNREEW